MALFSKFLNDRRGDAVGRYALIAGALAFVSVVGTHYLSIATRDGGSVLVAMFRPAKSPGVDYTATASIRRQAGQTVLDPCTGKPK